MPSPSLPRASPRDMAHGPLLAQPTVAAPRAPSLSPGAADAGPACQFSPSSFPCRDPKLPLPSTRCSARHFAPQRSHSRLAPPRRRSPRHVTRRRNHHPTPLLPAPFLFFPLRRSPARLRHPPAHAPPRFATGESNRPHPLFHLALTAARACEALATAMPPGIPAWPLRTPGRSRPRTVAPRIKTLSRGRETLAALAFPLSPTPHQQRRRRSSARRRRGGGAGAAGGGGRCCRRSSTRPAPRTTTPMKLRALHSFNPPVPTRHRVAPPLASQSLVSAAAASPLLSPCCRRRR
jgi:hypothetical protein